MNGFGWFGLTAGNKIPEELTTAVLYWWDFSPFCCYWGRTGGDSAACLFQIESEENVLICLRIIIELHKQFRPQITQEVRDGLPLPSCLGISSLDVCFLKSALTVLMKSIHRPGSKFVFNGYTLLLNSSYRSTPLSFPHPFTPDSSLLGLCEANLQGAAQSGGK